MAKTPRIAPSTSAATLLTFRQADLNPIGMIVSALLTEPQFQALNGASWVLLDGRSVTGSLYATTTGISTLPDARGLALRGKNSGGSALGTRSDGNQNPDGDVAVGTYQGDQIASHNHAAAGTSPYIVNTNSNQSRDLASVGSYSYTPLTPVGGNETRMRNITVNHFIKINP